MNWHALPALQTSDTPKPAPVDIAALFAPDHAGLNILPQMFAASPFLRHCANGNEALLKSVFSNGADAAFEETLAAISSAEFASGGAQTIGQHLRIARQKVALICAIAECGGHWQAKQSTFALARFADVAVEAALKVLIEEQRQKGKFLDGVAVTSKNCGLAIFALGKHGGQELNYSSDIDIVAFFDPRASNLIDPTEATKFFARLTQKLASILQDRDEFGYVFRTDLRLRPDPSSNPVAMSVDAALAYYESRGQNWERAAWSKARVCAGDHAVGEAFLADISPYIWRKHLDFAAIADIQAMKRQINISKNVGGQRLAGHNVKLGRGGIREIEFFVQTQLLIAGGRDQSLRVIPTEKALLALAAAGWVDQETCQNLIETYWFLRAVENRVQMIADEQTHILPTADGQLQNIAMLLGFTDLSTFEQKYLAALELVTRNYVDLFREQADLSSESGNLVFTGTDDDPATIENLQSMGFGDPSQTIQVVKHWHYGSYAATRTAAARAHLTEIIPLLLTQISATGNPDATLKKLDLFLQKLPAGVELFAMLRAHNDLCELLIALLAAAPKMADAIIRRAHVLDGLVDPSRADELIDSQVLHDKVEEFLGQAHAYEDLIDRARIVGQEQQFFISAGLVSGSISPRIAGTQFTTLAETLIDKLFAEVQNQFALRHGKIEGAEVGLLAFGKLGSKDMTASSDLDLILIYDVPDGAGPSNGERPLDAALYFARLTHRLITALSAPTATGVLYEVDMRLRPSGNKGPVATSLKAFKTYQAENAWTWEHLALTRARVISASDSLRQKLNSSIDVLLSAHRDLSATKSDIVDMRAKLLAERSARHPFDLKLADGGLMDIEFIAQSAILLFPEHRQTMLPHRTSILNLLELMGELSLVANADQLIQAYELMSGTIQTMSACLVSPFEHSDWPPAFKSLLARNANAPDFDRLEMEIGAALSLAREAYQSYFRD